MFAIGDTSWPGLGKLVEEMGELHQVLGKIIALRGEHEQYWDGTDLIERLIEELGDVRAAMIFFSETNDISKRLIHQRADIKLEKFRYWHNEGIKNTP